MSATSELQVLLGEIQKSREVLHRINAFHADYCARMAAGAERSTENAIVLADILVSYYTCLETISLRISQHFENSLSTEKWHSDLLHKMTIEVPGIRQAVLHTNTAAGLDELLKFRHFKRYYFEFNYDWERLDYLQKRFIHLVPALHQDLDRFVLFLQQLTGAH